MGQALWPNMQQNLTQSNTIITSVLKTKDKIFKILFFLTNISYRRITYVLKKLFKNKEKIMINKSSFFSSYGDMLISTTRTLLLLFSILYLVGCEGGTVPDLQTIGGETVDMDKRETVFGGEGIIFGDNGVSLGGKEQSTGIGVNAYLWRATLDTMSVWPITSADPFGGVIITDWYAPPNASGERFKMNIYILDRSLRADGVRVSVFKQVMNEKRGWVDAAVSKGVSRQLENAILQRARQFRNSSIID